MNTPLYITEMQILFEDIQKAQIFSDQKTMTDAEPLFSISEINQKYEKAKNQPYFNLKNFVLNNFHFPQHSSPSIEKQRLPIKTHIEKLWDVLTLSAPENKGTLLQLPKSYIVPGGRFNEFFYWDSYFIMLGLQTAKKHDMMKNIVENCSYLIQHFGFVPNASRTHFLSRSQPPYFSLMLDLLAESTNNQKVYSLYFNTLEKEYHFWMDGETALTNSTAIKRVIKTSQGDILNRYYDSENTPRPESYLVDLIDSKSTKNPNFYRNIRSACESGWDFSSRWFGKGNTIQSIEILNLAEIDLNCLIWHMENTLSKAAALQNIPDKEEYYKRKAEYRKKLINLYFWDEEAKIYKDYHFLQQKLTSSEHIATLYPLFLGLASPEQAKAIAETITKKFLYPGGLVTTTKQTGQQWDFPNAWAPYQWLGYIGFKKYGFTHLAEEIKNNWCKNVERVYNNTGKLMEKYNALDIKIVAGGGEYPNQDGFGWTNGVYIQLKLN